MLHIFTWWANVWVHCVTWRHLLSITKVAEEILGKGGLFWWMVRAPDRRPKNLDLESRCYEYQISFHLCFLPAAVGLKLLKYKCVVLMVWYPCELSGLHNYTLITPSYSNSLSYSLICRETSAYNLEQHYSKRHAQNVMIFYGGVLGGTIRIRKDKEYLLAQRILSCTWYLSCAGRYCAAPDEELIKFWRQSGSSDMSNWAKNSMIIVACPDWDEGNDPAALVVIQKPFTTKALHSLIHNYCTYCIIWGWWSDSAKEVCALWVLCLVFCIKAIHNSTFCSTRYLSLLIRQGNMEWDTCLMLGVYWWIDTINSAAGKSVAALLPCSIHFQCVMK